MYLLHVFILFLVILTTNLTFARYTKTRPIPVFLIDDDKVLTHLKVSKNPFVTINTENFAEIIQDVKNSSQMIVIFIEDRLSPEDISLRDRFGTPFHHLRSNFLAMKTKYYPSVINPYKTLTRMLPRHLFNEFYVSTKNTKLQIMDDKHKHFYVYFQDGINTTRLNALREHDVIMKEVYFVVRQLSPGPIVGIYTGKVNPIIRPDIYQQGDVRTTHSVTFNSAVGPIYFNGILYRTPEGDERILPHIDFPNTVEHVQAANPKIYYSTVTMDVAGYQLRFDYKFGEALWGFARASLLEGGEVVGSTGQPPEKGDFICHMHYGVSCRCDDLIIRNKKDGGVFVIKSYQLEVLANNKPSSRRTTSIRASFSPPAPCVQRGRFVTIGIVTSLFVLGHLLLLLFYGFLMMFDCKSNNRYEDPHGKHIMQFEE